MNISTETLNVLKNFSNISPSLVVKTGSILRTISPMKNIYAKFESPEVFESLTKEWGSDSPVGRKAKRRTAK